MAKIIGIAVGVALAIFAGPIGIGLFHSLFVTNFLINAGLGIAATGTLALFRKAPGGVSSGSQASMRQALSPWRVIYGAARVGGTITYIGTSGDKNKYLHLVVTIACHQTQQIATNVIYIDGKTIPLFFDSGSGYYIPSAVLHAQGSQFHNFLYVEVHNGDPDDTTQPFPNLHSECSASWTDSHLQRGRAKAHVRMKWSADLFGGGIPQNISFDVKGKGQLDLRTALEETLPALPDPNNSAINNTTILKVKGAEFAGISTFAARVTIESSHTTIPLYIDTARLIVTALNDQTDVKRNIEIKFSGATFVDLALAAISECDPILTVFDELHDYYFCFFSDGSHNSRCQGNAGVSDSINGGNIQVFHGAADVTSSAAFAAVTLVPATIWLMFKALEFGQAQDAINSNPAMCAYDYLTNPEYGLGISSDDIDVETFIAAANICDEQVDLDAGGSEYRYTCNGAFDVSAAHADILKGLASSMAGTIVPPSDKWRIYAGAYRSPVLDITDSDLRGPMQLSTRRSRRDLYNSVKGSYISPVNGWIPADYPPVTDSDAVTEDGELNIIDYPLGFTISASMCQRIAKIQLQRNRRQKGMSLPCKLKIFPVQPGDIVRVTHDRFGFTTKEFEVQSTTLISDPGESTNAPSLGVDIVLQEIDADVFAWDTTEEGTPETSDPPDFPSQDGAPPDDQVDFLVEGE